MRVKEKKTETEFYREPVVCADYLKKKPICNTYTDILLLHVINRENVIAYYTLLYVLLGHNMNL